MRWEVLAAINEIETDYGRNLNVSSRRRAGLDAVHARDVEGSTASTPTATAARTRTTRSTRSSPPRATSRPPAPTRTCARRSSPTTTPTGTSTRSSCAPASSAACPVDLVGSLTGLTQGRFPVAAKARYADDLDEQQGRARRKAGERRGRRGRRHAPRHPRLRQRRRRRRRHARRQGRQARQRRAPGPLRPGPRHARQHLHLRAARRARGAPTRSPSAARSRSSSSRSPPTTTSPSSRRPAPSVGARKERLFAHPARPKAFKAGGSEQVGAPARAARATTSTSRTCSHLKPRPGHLEGAQARLDASSPAPCSADRQDVVDARAAPAASRSAPPAAAPRGSTPSRSSTAGSCSSRPRSTARRSKNPFFGKDAKAPTIGQILLMSKEALAAARPPQPAHQHLRRRPPRQSAAGVVDRRVLALLEFLAANGLKPTVSSLFRPGSITASGNLSHHSTGTAVDISADQRHADHRPPGRRLDHRHRDPPPARRSRAR